MDVHINVAFIRLREYLLLITFLQFVGLAAPFIIRAPNCSLMCKFGYKTNIEGEPICECRKPCTAVMCFDGRKCVVEIPTGCENKPCRPRAYCKIDPGAPQTIVLPPDISKSSSFYIQNDSQSPKASLGTANVSPICYQAPQHTIDCARTKRRWYFDTTSGRCRKFSSCPGTRNNFQRRKECWRTCQRHIGRKRRKCRRKNQSERCKRWRHRRQNRKHRRNRSNQRGEKKRTDQISQKESNGMRTTGLDHITRSWSKDNRRTQLQIILNQQTGVTRHNTYSALRQAPKIVIGQTVTKFDSINTKRRTDFNVDRRKHMSTLTKKQIRHIHFKS